MTMGEIATSKRQITLFYNGNSSRAKKTLAYAKAEGIPIHTIDILQTPLTGTQIIELAKRLGKEVSELINQSHPVYRKKFEPHNLSDQDWVKMIQHNPDIMKQPIALRDDVSILVESPSDIIKI